MSKSIIEDLENDITQPALVMDTQTPSPEAFFSAGEDVKYNTVKLHNTTLTNTKITFSQNN